MIELYILVSLAAVGYILNTKQSSGKTSYKISKHDQPSCTTPYHSRYTSVANGQTQRRAQKMYEASQNPIKTGVVNRNYAFDKDTHEQRKIKSLTGDYVQESDFRHNNMIPYFGGRMRQNIEENANSSKLEAFTGNSQNSFYKQKCEVASFYDNSKDMTNINGMQNQDDFYRDRMVGSKMRTNETPVDKVYVGPGINKGFTATPAGGFQQFEAQDLIMPKCVDQLRAANKPKVTFEGRVVDGVKTKLRGDVGHMDKNRPDRFYEQTEDHFFKTTGANLKAKQIPQFNVKATNRLDTTKEYKGTAISTGAKARTLESSVRETFKDQLGEYGLRNVALQQFGKGDKNDYGKSTIMVFENERDITTTKVHQGNLTTIVKALIAPIQDLFKDTKKEEVIDNPRHFGNMNAQIPEKPTMYDPNDIAKTTTKETTIHETVNGNLKGHEKLTIYDPNDTARTTTKETTVHESTKANLKGYEKLTIYDPNDIARTTIKETLVHDDLGTGAITGPKQLFVYDPDEVAKVTGRETLDRMDYEMNISGGTKKATLYDPEDKARTTMKETTEDNLRDGNIDAIEGRGDYATTEYDAKRTQKQFTSDKDYYGGAMYKKDQGYQTNEYDAKNTQKQFLSDKDYYGTAESSNKAQKSYEDIYNAYISVSQESLLTQRDPTQTGSKTYVTNDQVTLSHRKQECDAVSSRAAQNIEKVNATEYAGLNEAGITRTKKEYGSMNDRLDPSLLKAYIENPYTQPLNSAV